MTLKELGHEIVLDSHYVDVYVWDESKEKYDMVMGFCDNVDISAEFNSIESGLYSDVDAKYLDYEVQFIGCECYNGIPIMRIEIEERSK